MRICAAADIHYPRFGREWSMALARRMCESGADVIILAGDVSAGPEDRYREFLSMFDKFDGPKLFVPGNHDLWTEDELPATEQRYRTQLPAIVERCGFHYLPGRPFLHHGVGIAGTVGWCDYGFRQEQAPSPGLHVTPMRAMVDDQAIKLRPTLGRLSVPWEDLTEEDYAGKALVWQTPDGDSESLVWNDAVHANWGMPDGDVARMMARELARDLRGPGAEVPTLVGVSHFVPFDELLAPFSDSPQAAYCRAYMGSPLLGQVLSDEPRVSIALCGHQHEQKVVQVGHIVAVNCAVAGDGAGPLILDVPGE